MAQRHAYAKAKPLIDINHMHRWKQDVWRRLPEHYRKRMMAIKEAEFKQNTATVHYKEKEGVWETGHHEDTLLPVQNRPIPVIYPKESKNGLWGGEGIIKGYVKRRKMGPRIPKIWTPIVREAVLYSEILDVFLKINVTDHALMLIDDAYGLDHYILKTKESDLRSELAMRLKQQMLMSLATKSLYPNDPVKREKVYEWYKKYLTMPIEEIEWLGLTEQEAIEKQLAIEKERNKPIPLKEILTQKLLQGLELGGENSNAHKEQREKKWWKIWQRDQ